MEEQFGTENLKKVITVACDFAKQAASSLSDGWQWTDFFSFVDEMAAIPGAVKSLAHVKEELANLSTEERIEIHAHFVAKFELPNEHVEAIIEDAVAWALSTLELVERFKALNSKVA